MPEYIIEGDTGEIGVLVIDWEKRKVTVHGVGGDERNSLSVAAAADIESVHGHSVQNAQTALPFVVWPRNADGFTQLAFRDTVDDIAGEIDLTEEQLNT